MGNICNVAYPEENMKGQIVVYFQEGDAFVDIGNGFLICIGTKEEAETADQVKLAEMITRALTLRRFESMGNVPKNQQN